MVRMFIFRVTVKFKIILVSCMGGVETGSGRSTTKPSFLLLPYLSSQSRQGLKEALVQVERGKSKSLSGRAQRPHRENQSHADTHLFSHLCVCHQLAVSAKSQKVNKVCEPFTAKQAHGASSLIHIFLSLQ